MHDMKEKLSLLWIFAPSRPSKPERPAPEWGRRQPARAFQACVPGDALSTVCTRSAVRPKPREPRWLACAWTKMPRIKKVPENGRLFGTARSENSVEVWAGAA